jgi:hypothetical protein
MHAILVERLHTPRAVMLTWQYLPEVYVETRRPTALSGHAMVPVLLRLTSHHQQVTTTQPEITAGGIRIN